MSPKHRVNVNIDVEQWTMLKALRDETGAPIAESIRRAIGEYLRRHPPQKAGIHDDAAASMRG
jgi:hypothetical protein